MRRFLLVIEKAAGNYSGFFPDVPGCVATGRTKAEVARRARGALRMHLRGLAEDNLPTPASSAAAVEIVVE